MCWFCHARRRWLLPYALFIFYSIFRVSARKFFFRKDFLPGNRKISCQEDFLTGKQKNFLPGKLSTGKQRQPGMIFGHIGKNFLPLYNFLSYWNIFALNRSIKLFHFTYAEKFPAHIQKYRKSCTLQDIFSAYVQSSWYSRRILHYFGLAAGILYITEEKNLYISKQLRWRALPAAAPCQPEEKVRFLRLKGFAL